MPAIAAQGWEPEWSRVLIPLACTVTLVPDAPGLLNLFLTPRNLSSPVIARAETRLSSLRWMMNKAYIKNTEEAKEGTRDGPVFSEANTEVW